MRARACVVAGGAGVALLISDWTSSPFVEQSQVTPERAVKERRVDPHGPNN